MAILSSWVAIGLLCGALVGFAILLLVIAIRGTEPRAAGTPSMFRHVSNRNSAIRWGAAVVVGLLVLVLTHWIVMALALGALVVLAPRIFGGSAQENRDIARLDALATWTEALRDTIAGAVGLEQAIPATAANAGASIRPGLNLLVDRLRIREPLPSALLRFADDLDDPSADLVIASLVLNARLRGPGLREVLSALAVSAREELDVRFKVASERRATRRSVQIVVGVVLLVAGAMVLFNRSYVAPYSSLLGQLFLVFVIGIFTLGLMWLRRLAKVEVPERFLVNTQGRQMRQQSAEVVEL